MPFSKEYKKQKKLIKRLLRKKDYNTYVRGFGKDLMRLIDLLEEEIVLVEVEVKITMEDVEC